jgi:hypothetical protein
MKNFISLLMIFLLISCAHQPILDQNDKYRTAGKEQAETDIKACRKEAEDYLDQYKASRAAKAAVRQGAVGGAIGAATGAIFGHGLKSIGVGALIGAGVGAAFGGGSVLAGDKVTPDQIKQRYMINCLNKQGYSVLGWE